MTVSANAIYTGDREDAEPKYFPRNEVRRYSFKTYWFSPKVKVYRVHGHDMDTGEALIFRNAIEFALAFQGFDDIKGFWE